MARSQRAIQEAAREAAEAVGAIQARREFTISKFGRHPDGYLHARVVVRGQPFYFHRRYGSWLAPGAISGRAMLKEPEGLLGSVLGREVKYALSEKSSPFDTADRRQREAAAEAAKKRSNDAGHERRVDGSATDPSGVLDGGDDPSAEEAVRSD